MKRDWIKVYRLAQGATIMAVNETHQGADTPRVRVEGRVFGSTGKTVKHFATPAQADAFFDAFTQDVAEDWWASLIARVEVEIDNNMLYGHAEPTCQARGVLHA
ncbi:hypothetical protein AB4P93_00210 (plasmid) [Pseudomonas sp. B26140]|uniref:hypothetical protein n=1 Tax=Pseudomonas sp. B26140 TaxID=3235112 RepID=UPI003782F05A